MKRRVHEDRQPAAAPGQTDDGETQTKAAPPAGVRVAGEVRDRDITEVERIAGVLEVTSWIKRLSTRKR